MQELDHKIFGIGLPKTGTVSLNIALKMLGIDSFHYPITDVIPGLEEGSYEPLASRSGFTNCGEWHFAALEREFPTAKFIYTARPFNDWIKSVKRHYEAWPAQERGSADYINRVEIFATSVYDPDIMETIYWAHKGAVERHFNGKGNLLTLDVSEEDALGKLCRFLNVAVRQGKFPHENRSDQLPTWDEYYVRARQPQRGTLSIRSFAKVGLLRGLRMVGFEVRRIPQGHPVPPKVKEPAS
jgi:hypothetical protein